MLDPTDTVATSALLEKRARRDRRNREIEGLELRRILSSELGRTFVMRLVERAGVFRLSIAVDNFADTHGTAFREGCRNEGVRLFRLIIDSCPELWTTMLKERAERLAAEAKEEME